MAGLNGKGWFHRLLEKATTIVAIAIAGPMGGIVDQLIWGYINGHTGSWRPVGDSSISATYNNTSAGKGTNDDDLTPNQLNQLNIWQTNIWEPWYQDFKNKIEVNSAALTTQIYIDRLNGLMEQLHVWQIYYETLAASESDNIVYLAKIEVISAFIETTRKAYEEATNNNSPFKWYLFTFNPLTYTNIGREQLDWYGIKSLTGYTLKLSKTKPTNTGGGSTTIGGNTGGVSIGATNTGGTPHGGLPNGGNNGGSTGSGSTGGGPIKTGGGFAETANPKPPKTGGGSVTIPNPAPTTKPPTQQNNGTTPEKKGNNNKIWLIGIGIAALAIFTKKK